MLRIPYDYLLPHVINMWNSNIVKKNKKQKTLTPLAGLSFGFILTGIIFGDNRFIGYSLVGIGVLLAVIDIIRKLKKK